MIAIINHSWRTDRNLVMRTQLLCVGKKVPTEDIISNQNNLNALLQDQHVTQISLFFIDLLIKLVFIISYYLYFSLVKFRSLKLQNLHPCKTVCSRLRVIVMLSCSGILTSALFITYNNTPLSLPGNSSSLNTWIWY